MTVHLTQYLSFPWEFVSSLFWKRYPNPHARHVLSVDVLERYLLPNGKLYTKRLVIKKISRRIPSWLLKYFPGGQVPVVEESIIDVNTKRIDVVSTNFGHYKKYLLFLSSSFNMRADRIQANLRSKSYSVFKANIRMITQSVGEYSSLVPSNDNSVTKVSRVLSLESSLKGFLRLALMKTSQTYYHSSSNDTYLGYLHVCNKYSSIANSQEQHSSVNEASKNSTKMSNTHGTREYTSKLPHVVMAESG
ncbi:Protein ups1 like [Schistosoma japonicum]|nr:Protein ups1 like [Schistosoma japonicum]